MTASDVLHKGDSTQNIDQANNALRVDAWVILPDLWDPANGEDLLTAYTQNPLKNSLDRIISKEPPVKIIIINYRKLKSYINLSMMTSLMTILAPSFAFL